MSTCDRYERVRIRGGEPSAASSLTALGPLEEGWVWSLFKRTQAGAIDSLTIVSSTNKPPSLLLDLCITQVVVYIFISKRLMVGVCLSLCLEKVGGGFLGENFRRGPSEMSGLQQLL